MADLVITVAETHEPRPGGKQGRVVDTSGKSWQVWGDKLNQFHIGASYKVEDWKTNSFEGRNFITINKFSVIGGAAAPKAAAKPQHTPYGSTDDKTAERIFVAGAYNNWMGKPGTDVPTESECVGFVNMQRRVWTRTFGGKPTFGDDMNDEIPSFEKDAPF